MKKAIFGFLAVAFLMPVAGNAVELNKGAVTCISQKYLDKYVGHIEDGATKFSDTMLDRAQCFIKRRTEIVQVLSEVGENIQVETVDGFKIWVKSADITQK